MGPNGARDYPGAGVFRASQLHTSGGSVHIGSSSGALETCSIQPVQLFKAALRVCRLERSGDFFPILSENQIKLSQGSMSCLQI